VPLPRLILVVVSTTIAAFAWHSPRIHNVCNSAPGPGSTLVVNADVTGPHTDQMTARLFYSTDSQSTWTEVDMQLLGTPGFDSTHQATFTAPSSGIVYYYVRASDGWGWATQVPFNSADAWPVPANLRAQIADEPSGDVINNPDGPFLDLTGIWMTYSATHLYARMTNDDDEWPIRRTIIGPWYLYAAGFRNPDAAQDTWAFAMAYGNVLGIYTPGLYQINGYTFDFEKFADIDYRTDGNVLEMRCAIADLVANTKFGPWPIPSGYLRAARGDTRSVDISQNNTLHDTTNQSRCYVDRTPRITVGDNRAPALSNAGILPRHGPPGTQFYFGLYYTDPDTNLPVVRAVIVDDSDTLDLIPRHHRYHEDVLYTRYDSGFPIGLHRFHFLFYDGMAQVTTPEDTFRVDDTTGIVAQAPWRPVETLSASPNPFTSRVRLQAPFGTRVLQILNSTGRMVHAVRTRIEGRFDWDGCDESGNELPPGVYFIRDADQPARRLRLVRIQS
jgi:hypothetical protein